MYSALFRLPIVMPKIVTNWTLIDHMLKISQKGLIQTIYFHIMGPFRVLITFIKQKIGVIFDPHWSVKETYMLWIGGCLRARLWYNIMNKATMIEFGSVHNMNFLQK
jgi:hypothetical protein